MARVNLDAVEALVDYSTYIGNDLISLKGIRSQQDEDLVKKVRERALRKIGKNQLNETRGTSFFIGSVDFMVNDRGDGKEFSIIETNGGSSRGLSAIHKKGWELMYDGLLRMLRFADDDPLVLIGYPDGDRLLQEKIFLSENFRREAGLDLNLDDRAGPGEVVLRPYSKILPKLGLQNNDALFDGNKIGVMVGDGIVRRKDELEERGKKGKLNTIFANEIFPETDDKALTYRAVKEAADELKEFRIHPLDYWRARNKEELIRICKERIDDGEEIVIKPYGGSGGSGIDIIEVGSGLEERIDNSLNDFYGSFEEGRNPFPYTICEKVDFRPITWRNSKRNFDIRIYLTGRDDELIPVGGLARIALEPFSDKMEKKSFVVNLSGYEGIDVDRGIGISEEGLEILELTEEDLVDMFAASVTLFKNMVDHHEDLIGDWKSYIWKE